MTENALATQVDTAIVEQVVMKGDLGQLTPEQRLEYYRQVCASMGLNPLTRPFDYINLHGKLILYAKRDAADQLRKIHRISIDKPDVKIEDDLVIVSVTGRDKTGRTDSELGVVFLGRKQGDDKANSILKAITKAKRRLTLSIVGLGWLDETEVETIPNAQPAFPPEHAAAIDERAELAEAERAARELGFEEGIIGNAEPSAPAVPTARRSWPSETIKAVVDSHLAQNPPNAVAMLNKSTLLVTTDDLSLVMEWANRYRRHRENGAESDSAAKLADTEMKAVQEAD